MAGFELGRSWTALGASHMRIAGGWWLAAAIVVLAFAFLGARGIWDPDEGRYTNVALNMLDSGDWVDLRRNDDTGHWTKPPLTYWSIAASVGAFGRSPWAARLPMALAYLACAWLAWRMARRLAPGSETPAALAFATMLLPFGASQLVTTDFLLAAFQSLAMLAFVEARFGKTRHERRWLLAMWLAFALAFLVKGPPALVPLLAVFAYDAWVRQPGRAPVLSASGLALFAVVALPWFLVVGGRHPGLLEHLIGAEVVARVASDRFARNGSSYGWLQVYVPTLIVGTMPWTFALWRALRRLAAGARAWRSAEARRADAPAVLLLLWIVLPLLVFCVARSRLPLYILPLFVPLALLVARQWAVRPDGAPSLPRVATWCVLLLGIKVVAAFWPTHKDAEQWADAIRARVPFEVREVVFVEDMARYGINLHLRAEIEKLSIDAVQGERFNPEYDESLAEELAEGEEATLYIAPVADWNTLRNRVADANFTATRHGAPFYGRVMFSVAPCVRECRRVADNRNPGRRGASPAG